MRHVNEGLPGPEQALHVNHLHAMANLQWNETAKTHLKTITKIYK